MPRRPRDGAPGTTDQSPRWEGPEENRPRGYLPARDDPNAERDAAGENLADPEKRDLSDAFETRGDEAREQRIRQRAYEIWLREGQPEGEQDRHWQQAEREIEEEGAD
jgi:hypothetical protein